MYRPEFITDEQWNGNKAYNIDTTYTVIIDDKGTKQCATQYRTYFGGGHTVLLANKEVVVQGEISFDESTEKVIQMTTFKIYGLFQPKMWCYKSNSNGAVIPFDSEKDGMFIFNRYFLSYLSTPPFESKFGKLFRNRIVEILNKRGVYK